MYKNVLVCPFSLLRVIFSSFQVFFADFSMLKLILLFFIHFLYGALADPIVTTNYGKLQGFSLDLENDVVADVFLRVPFAEPPVKNLRLEVIFSSL